MTVDEQIEKILAAEGAYTNDPTDRGGPTNWGITEREARVAGYTGAMIDLPRGFAKAIYLDRYFMGPHLDRVEVLSSAIADELLDTGVNCGTATAIKMLQRVLNAFNANGALYEDVEVDGHIGLQTLAALADLLKHRSRDDGELTILKALNGLQCARYLEIAEADHSQEVYVYGWVRARVSI